MKNVLLLLFLLGFGLNISPCYGQRSTLDIVGMHQLIDESTSEYPLQVQARNQQATTAANEQANLTLLQKLKNLYRTLQQRYNALGTAIDLAGIGLQAEPMVGRIIYYQGQIIQLAEKNPAAIALGLQTEIQFAEQAEALLGYVSGLVFSIGDVNQMKASDRKLLFDYVIAELSKLQELSANMMNLLQYSNLNATLRALNPFQAYVNRDKIIVNNIFQNAKYLKK